MLRIYYGQLENENYIFSPDIFFNNMYEDEWITEPTVKRMIKDIDGSEVIGPRAIDSPYLGLIPTERLSGGVKTLILMKFDHKHIFNASACGDNCAEWILKIAEEAEIKEGRDLTIRLGYLMNFGEKDFEIEIVNLGKIVHTIGELNEMVLAHHLI